MVAKSFFMTWHMQQEDRVKMMTGCSDMSRWILVSVDSSRSMESEEEELLMVGLSSSSFEFTNPDPIPCILSPHCDLVQYNKRRRKSLFLFLYFCEKLKDKKLKDNASGTEFHTLFIL